MKLMNVNDKLHGFSNRRQKRLLMEKQNGIYHVVTRTSCRRFLLNGAREKAMFVALMRKQAAFCGVEVLAHCVMSCLLYTSPSPRDGATSRMPSSA